MKIPNNSPIYKVISEVRSKHPTTSNDSMPLIAGGCLRDSYFNRDYKDIDVFISTDEFSSHAEIMKFCKSLDFKMVEICESYAEDDQEGPLDSDDRYWQAMDVDLIVKVKTRYSNHPVDLVFVAGSPKDYVTRIFDTGISRIYYDGNPCCPCGKSFGP